jgi:hypothetical protein
LNIACNKEYSCEGCYGNKSPVANAEKDTTIILPVDSVKPDGSASYDTDGTIISYQWSKISGPVSFIFTTATAAKNTVKNLIAGVYQFELKVTDNGGLPAKDTVQIFVIDPAQPNQPLVADAGIDQTILLPASTTIHDGSGSYDLNNNITSYACTKISGPTAFSILNPGSDVTQLTNLVEGIYQFELKVTDAGNLFAKNTMLVNVNPEPLPSTCTPFNRPIINEQLIPFGTLSEARRWINIASTDNKIVFAGGQNLSGPSSAVDIYDMSTHTWTETQISNPFFR